ncbi:MAG: hypothetical protein SFW64_03625 [Alphaproteobacteria bacterium]|nr:hypothetical protein [Alphaproteobacteria bacterium]
MPDETHTPQAGAEADTAATPAQAPRETGTSNLLMGAGIGAYGTASFVATGAICPVCIVLTPVLLGAGAYQRLKSRRAKAGGTA